VRSHPRLAVGVESVVDDPFGAVELVVVLEPQVPEAFRDGLEARRLRLVPECVVSVKRAVDDTISLRG
jgi:hypothetical protein